MNADDNDAIDGVLPLHNSERVQIPIDVELLSIDPPRRLLRVTACTDTVGFFHVTLVISKNLNIAPYAIRQLYGL
jgi:hypothetical protein